MSILIDFYVALIIAHRRSINNVLGPYKPVVLADLNAIVLDGYGNPLPDPSP